MKVGKYTGGQTNNESRAIYKGSNKKWREGSIQLQGFNEIMELEQYTDYRGSKK